MLKHEQKHKHKHDHKRTKAVWQALVYVELAMHSQPQQASAQAQASTLKVDRCVLQHREAAWQGRLGGMLQPWTLTEACGCGEATATASWAWAASRSLWTRPASPTACEPFANLENEMWSFGSIWRLHDGGWRCVAQDSGNGYGQLGLGSKQEAVNMP